MDSRHQIIVCILLGEEKDSKKMNAIYRIQHRCEEGSDVLK